MDTKEKKDHCKQCGGQGTTMDLISGSTKDFDVEICTKCRGTGKEE